MQGTKAAGEPGARRAAAVTLGLRARLRWELQGTLGGEKCKVTFWLPPSPAYIEAFGAAEESQFVFSPTLRIHAQMVFCISKKNSKLITNIK